ncbi:hypothetical protein HKD37_12G034630 [Glycine soja]
MANVELSTAREERLKAALAKLATAQRRLESTLDALLLKLPPRTSHHYPSSSVSSPPPPPPPMSTPPLLPALIQSAPHTLVATPLPMQTPSPMLTQPPMPPPPPMPTPPPLPALIQLRPTPLPTSHLSALDHVRATIPISDHLFSTVLSYGHATTPHDKHG